MKQFKKINLILLSALFCLSSCQEKEENYYSVCFQFELVEPDYTIEDLYELSDFVYLIELEDILGTWYSQIYNCGTNYDVWGYTIIESYKGISDNYYMFIRYQSLFADMPELISGSLYYVFLFDYSDYDYEGFPEIDNFISLHIFYPEICIYPAEDIGE